MNLNKLISFVSILLILIMLAGVVSATDANSAGNLESSKNITVEQHPAVTSSSYGAQGASEVLGAGDSEVIGAGEGTFTELHELISTGSTINLEKDYKYNPDVDGKYAWNGVDDVMDYKDGVPILDRRAGFNSIKTITINGNGHTIDGNHMARIFNATFLGMQSGSGTNLILNNITFINGYMERDNSGMATGGAIFIGPYKATVTLNHCTFENNSAVNLNMGDPVGDESTWGTAWGGAIYVNAISGTDYSTLYVNDCTFRNNTANYGGAISSAATNNQGKVYITNSIFDDNHANSHPYNYSNGIYYFEGLQYSHGWGGAVYSYYTDVRNSTFVNNKGGNNSGYGGAISTYIGNFKDSKFINNTCYQGAAIADGHMVHGTSAVDTGDSEYHVDNCTFDNNKAQLSGGAILTRNIAGYFKVDVFITNTNFTNNYGGIYGGGAVMSAWPSIQNTKFINNSAYNYGGAVSSGSATLSDVAFINNSAAHAGALFCIEPYFDNDNVTFDGNKITPRVLYDNGFTINDTEVQDGKIIVGTDLSLYQTASGRYYILPSDWSAWRLINNPPSIYMYRDNSKELNNGIGFYGFDFEVDLYGHAIEYDHKDVKGGYGQVSPGGAEGIVTDDLSYLINYIDGRELKEYIKILYYLCNLDPNFMHGAFRNEEEGELALEFPIHELCYSNLSKPINELMKNITDLYDSGFRVPDKYYLLSEVLKDHMAHSDVMVPKNAVKILEDTETTIFYRPFLYIVPFYHTHYLCYYQTIMKIEKIARNKTVLLGEDVEFEVKVTNLGNRSVYDIFVKDDDYDHDGLEFKGYRNGTGHWVYDPETKRYNLVDNVTGVYYTQEYNDYYEPVKVPHYYNTTGALGPRDSKSIIFIFTTVKTGAFNNTATNGYNNATNNTTVVSPDMKVEKITLNKTVYLGNITMFKIRVTNIGEVDLTNIIVDEVDYDEGLVLADWKGDFPWFGNINTKKFVYLDTLKPHESAEFIVIFNTTSSGNKTNYVNASSKQTGNRSANNSTEIVPIRVNITKEWEDNDNQDGIRPESVTVHLFADGVEVDKAILNASNGWTVLFKDLPMVKNGKVINYTVSEDPIDKYEAEIINITTDDFSIIVANNTYNFTVNNTHVPEVTSINVTKVWDDADNQDGIRPENVTVILVVNGADNVSVVLNESNNWKGNFTNLPVYKDGVPIVYTVREDRIDGYDEPVISGVAGNWTVTNTHVPEVTEVSVVKVWNDSDNQDGIRNASVTVVLLADGKMINSTVLNAANNWKFTFTDLPARKNGALINYTVAETDVPTGYTVNVTSDNLGNWTVINTHVPELVNVTVNKVWEDNDDYDKVRPASVSVQLYANGVKVNETTLSGDKWEYTFIDLPKYKDGSLIVYTVNETAVDGYNTTIDNFTIINSHVRPDMAVEKITINKTVLLGQETSFTIVVTNTGNVKLSDISVVEEVPEGLCYDGKFTGKNWFNNGLEFVYKGILNPGESISFNITFATLASGNWTNVVMASSNETENKTANNNTTVIPIVVNVTKVWDDGDNQDGVRSGSVTVVLFADGVKVNEAVLNDGNDWKYSFKELPAYKDGNIIKYTIGEVEVTGYTVAVTNDTAYNWTVTNTHVPEVTSINVTKVWDDADDQDGVRPENVTVILVVDGVDDVSVVLNESNGWKGNFTGLPVYKDGVAIVYTVREDRVVGYDEPVISGVAGNWTVTNTHVPELVNISVIKVWDDADNQDGVRSGSVTVVLFADGVKVNETVLNDGNEWKYLFKDLPKFKSGELIKYTVNETAVAGYTVDITDDGNGNWTVTNTHVPELVNVTVNKVWEDNDDWDKVRPASVSVQLYANGVKVNETTLSGDKWEYTFIDLPKYKDGSLIVYTVNETAVDGYNTTIDNFTIINSHVRPDMAVEKITINKTVLLGQETSFTIVVTNTGNVKLSDISVVEEVPEGLCYDGKFTGKNWFNNGLEFVYKGILNPGESISFNITFATLASGNWTNVVMASSNETENKSANNNTTVIPVVINVTKVWDDGDDQDGIRSGSVIVYLLADGVKVNETVLSDDNKWSGSFVELPAYKDGKKIVYTVGEDKVDGYDVSINEINGSFVITNTHVPELVNVSVNKVWDDADNQDGVRPVSVTVVLFADGVKVNETTLSEDNGWKFLFKDLPKFKSGELIKYSVDESEVDNYTVDITDDSNGNWTVTNTHVPELVNVTVNKVWEDNDDWDKVRPASVSVQLYANGVKVNETTLSGDKWEYTFIDLPKYKDGSLIVYTVNETAVDGYNTTIDNFTIINSHVRPDMAVEKITINKTVLLGQETSFTIVVTNTGNVKLSGISVVEDVPAGLRYDGKFTGENWSNNGVEFIYNGILNPGESISFNITFATVKSGNWTNVVMASSNETENKSANNNTTVIPVVINVTKEWNDGDDQDGIRSGSVIVYLLADGVKVNETVLSDDNKWSGSFVELPAYKDGKKIVYTVGEDKVDGYDVSINEINGSFVITNTHVPELVNVSVNKVWDDADNQDGVRPVSVTVVLFADGVKVNETTLSEDNGWKFLFKDLPKFKSGELIKYSVDESEVDNYTVDITNDGNGNWTVTNTHVPDVTEVSVVKVWNDADDQDGVRPAEVTIVLLGNGSVVASATLNASNDWKTTFGNLPVYSNGNVVSYSVQELDVAGYTSVISNGTAYEFTVTNTHVPDVTVVNVNKVWNDADNQDGVRPAEVTVVLVADGSVVASATLNASNNWYYAFSDLPVYSNGKVISYSVQELDVAGYTSVISNGTAYEFTVTNTHVPDVTVVNVNKVWNDNNDQDGVRPASVVVVLKADGDVVGTATLNASNRWSASFTGLPVNKAGKVIVYSVEEVDVANYTSVVSADGEYSFIVNNTHVPVVTEVSVVKVWNDADDQDGVRPTGVTVVLVADGSVVAGATLNASNDWKTTFGNLPVYSNGNVVSYSVQELDVAGYTSVISNGTAYEFTVTNTHVPDVTVVNVNKVWNDNNDQDGVRPVSVVVVLKADGDVVGTATLNASNNWSASFRGLSVYKNNGTLIEYSVEELDVANYTSVVSSDSAYSFIVNNTHVPAVTDVSVVKVWNDADDQDGVRPSEIIVVLKADGDIVDTATLNANNNWSASFRGLSVYKNNGTLIEYSVEELDVANYTSIVSSDSAYSFIVNNTHVPVVTVVDVAKVWSDNNNQDGVRPANVVVVLKADGNVVATATLNAYNNWHASFENLPVYSNAQVIEYSVEEVSVANYTSVVFADSAYSFTINNVHNPVVTVVDVAKVWSDNNNQDGVRPDSVVVVLKADGNVIGTATLNDNNNWRTSFTDLPVYDNGKVIVYSVEELDVASYSAVISNNGEFSFIVTNVHVPETTSVNVTKVWSDNNNQDGIRPSSITVVLVADGNVINSAVLNDGNSWKATFADLPVYSNGNVIAYSIEEVSVANYTTVISNAGAYDFIVNNTHIPVITSVNITKVWKDTEEKEKTSVPIEVIIYADGVPVANATLFPGNDWKLSIDDLPVYHDGKVINYTIGVIENNHTTNISADDGNFTILDEPVLHPDMSVRKITLDTQVEVGDIVSFVIVVENTGDCELTGVYVIDNDYSDGLEYLYMESDDDWIDEGDGRFTLARTLGIGESASLTVVFEATSAGFKVNNVTAGNNLTNETVKSSNTTNVTEEVPEPDVPEVPDVPDVPHKHHVPKHVKPDTHATGNPIVLLLLALFVPLIRRKQK